MSHFTQNYLNNISRIASLINSDLVDSLAIELDALRKRKGRLFFLGVGGSAANCSHAVNDFRKLCHIETYAPTDNVSELTARTNDDGWHSTFSSWLTTSQVTENDALFILSVGGGDKVKNISTNIVYALDKGKEIGMKIFGIVGPHGGYTAQMGDHVLIIPSIDSEHTTPYVESFQSILWHCLVSHPKLQYQKAKWEQCLQKN